MKQELLLSDEYRFDTFFTKFPGGGVEYGEGILDALAREFKEELNSEITSSELIFLNEFFQNPFSTKMYKLLVLLLDKM